MHNHHAENPSVRPEPQPLAVHRLKPGTKGVVWTLSKRIAGCQTHFVKGQSEYCQGAICRPDWHRIPPIWKGFIAACVWTLPDGLWRPCVLEVTEALEKDMRGLYARGQVWELTVAHKTKRTNPPLRGRLVKQETDCPVPEAFPILDVLRTLYRVEHIELNAVNTQTARQLMEPVEGPIPRSEESESAESRPTPEQFAELRRRAGLDPRDGGGGSNGKRPR
jgi:hypothetical protein